MKMCDNDKDEELKDDWANVAMSATKRISFF